MSAVRTHKWLAGKRRREARRLNRRARERDLVRATDTKRHRKAKSIHPRDRYWYGVGVLHARVYGEHRFFFFDAPTHGGGSYYARYRAMYEAGFNAAKAS